MDKISQSANLKVQISMRRVFADALYNQMAKDKKIWLVTGDLGYKMWDKIRADFPNRFINAGVSEQAMMGIAVGLAQEGNVPIVYSITPFLLFRPFETIRNYINFEKIPVKLVGSGRGNDYLREGFSHWALEDRQIMKIFGNIVSKWPKNTREVSRLTVEMIKSPKPWYLNLKR